MKPIKAIQTRYKGRHFRSRLEARWAVVLDELGIEWDYEPEGFELFNGMRYLPDFWLPNEQVYLEIKGVGPTDADRLKAAQLACLTVRPVYVLSGNLSNYRITEYVGRPLADKAITDWLEKAEAAMPESMRQHFALSEAIAEQFAFPGVYYEGNFADSSEEFVWLDVDSKTGLLAVWEATEEPLSLDYEDRWGRYRNTGGIRQDEFSTYLRIIGRTYEYRALDIREPWDPQGPSERTVAAIEAGLSARFEHGESGAS